MTELEKKVRVKILKTVLNRSDKTYAKQALDYINELEEQLILHGVIQSIGVNNERILGILSQEQVDKGLSNCGLCKYKRYSNKRNECVKCVNEGQPHQYFL